VTSQKDALAERPGGPNSALLPVASRAAASTVTRSSARVHDGCVFAIALRGIGPEAAALPDDHVADVGASSDEAWDGAHMTRRRERKAASAAAVRRQRASDALEIADLHKEAFGQSGDAVSNLVLDLTSTTTPSNGLSLVAIRDDRIVGHVLFTRGLVDAPARLVGVQMLSPLAVIGTYRRRGIGSELVRRGVAILGDRRVPLVFLEGAPDYYAPLGFLPAGPLGFRKPSLRIPDAAFQVLTLPAYAPWMTGTLVYSEAFWRHDLVGLREPVGQ
jgi:putative acetyltransferase